MQIVAYINAPILQNVSTEEFLPIGHNSIQFFGPAIAERYNFQAHGEPEGGSSYIFQNGRFIFEEIDTPILSMDFQGDKMVAMCSTTPQGLAFLDDMTEFLVSTFKFRRPKRNVISLLSSAIVVDFGTNVLAQLSGVAKIHSLMNSRISGMLEGGTLEAQSLKFAGRVQLNNQKAAGISYTLEERIGRPPGTNWLFSYAPLSSETHVEFLNELSELFDLQKDI